MRRRHEVLLTGARAGLSAAISSTISAPPALGARAGEEDEPHALHRRAPAERGRCGTDRWTIRRASRKRCAARAGPSTAPGRRRPPRAAEYDAVNLEGTRSVVRAVNQEKGTVGRLGPYFQPQQPPSRRCRRARAGKRCVPAGLGIWPEQAAQAEELVREILRGALHHPSPGGGVRPARRATSCPVFEAVRRHLMPLIGGGRMRTEPGLCRRRCRGGAPCSEEVPPRPDGKRAASHRRSPAPRRIFLREIAAAYERAHRAAP